MKKSIKTAVKSAVAAVIFTSLVTTSFAQTNRFSFSINSLTTNFNYGKSNSELLPYKKNFKGLQAGASYQAGVTPMFSVVTELYFAMKGGTLKENNPLTTNISTLRLYTLEMPVLARLHCNRLYLNAGPYASYSVGGRLKTEGTEAIPETSTRISFGRSAGDFKRWDLGFQAGAGYNFNLKKSTLTLDVRYGYGLVNVSKDVERYNRMLNISVLVSKPSKKNKSAQNN